MKKQLHTLTEAEQEEFTEKFYEYVAFDDLGDDNPLPWGQPWLWDSDELEAETVQDLLVKFIAAYKKDITDIEAKI